MLLNEFIYFEKPPLDSLRYDPKNDQSVLKRSDTRKSRLTLGMINEIRLASDAQELERRKDLELIRKMYAAPATETPV